MEEEYNSLIWNKTWDLVPFHKGKKLVQCKWIYRTKFAVDGSIDKFKAWLMAKGFSHIPGVVYTETLSLATKMNSIHLILAIVATQGWVAHQMDVKSAFLHRDLHEDIYIE
jgi:hypothetical protein